MKKNNKHYISDIILERYILEELPEGQMQQIKHIVETDETLMKRLETLNQSSKLLLQKYPPQEMAFNIQQRYEQKSKQPAKKNERNKSLLLKLLAPPLFGLSTAAIFLLLIFPHLTNNSDLNPFRTDNNEITRLKGDSGKIYIYRKKGQNVEILKNGSIAYEHDLLQLAYLSTTDKYGVIFSIDGRGVVTLHYPIDQYQSAKLDVRKKTLINKAYELDDAPDFERFFFITSRNDFDIDEIIKQAYLIAYNTKRVLTENLKLSENYKQYSITIYKGK